MERPLSAFRAQLIKKGLSIAKFARLCAVPYITAYQHVTGARGVSPKIALKYAKALNMPASFFRPDLWGRGVIQEFCSLEGNGEKYTAPECHEVSRHA